MFKVNVGNNVAILIQHASTWSTVYALHLLLTWTPEKVANM